MSFKPAYVIENLAIIKEIKYANQIRNFSKINLDRRKENWAFLSPANIFKSKQ
jgi:hypothetical protein